MAERSGPTTTESATRGRIGTMASLTVIVVRTGVPMGKVLVGEGPARTMPSTVTAIGGMITAVGVGMAIVE